MTQAASVVSQLVCTLCGYCEKPTISTVLASECPASTTETQLFVAP
jgi:hypothetical protein